MSASAPVINPRERQVGGCCVAAVVPDLRPQEAIDLAVVVKALADPSRRHLLDRLRKRDGQTLSELCAELDMTRFGAMKHLRVLEDAGLVVTRREGREKHHFLNPVPIRLIHDRWIDKYTERQVAALTNLKNTLEEAQ